jgi:RNA polymerase sigma factor (sigma-70 family)
VPGRDPLADPDALIRRVYAYVAYRVGDGADAEDITSSTFERALRYRDRFDSRRGDPADWLLGIARRQLSDHFADRPTPVAEVPEEIASGDLEDESATRLDLRGAVMALDERDQELVALRYGADLTARQIGELLGMRTNAVEVALHRALRELRAKLGGSPGERPSAARRDLRAAE